MDPRQLVDLLPQDADPVMKIVISGAAILVTLLLTASWYLVGYNFLKDFLDGIRARDETAKPHNTGGARGVSSLGSNEAVWEQTKSSGRSVRDVGMLALKTVAVLFVVYLCLLFAIFLVLSLAESVAN